MRDIALGRGVLATRCIACMAVGVAVNVLVAWGLALLVDLEHGWHELGHGSTGYSRERAPDTAHPRWQHLGWGSDMLGRRGRIHASVWYQWLPDGDRYLGAGQPRAESAGHAMGLDHAPSAIVDGTFTEVALIVQASGWPFLSLKTELGIAAIDSRSTSPGPIACPRRGGIEIASRSRWLAPHPLVGYPAKFGSIIIGPRQRELPIQPLWAGFIANSLVYALIAASLWTAVLAVRRHRRRRSGRCPNCAHPLAGAGFCPECGTRIVES